MVNFLERVLGFFNVLEPDRQRVSLTKASVWIALFCLVVSTFRSPENFGAAVAGMVPVLANYAHRYGRRPVEDCNDRSVQKDDNIAPTAGAQ